MRGYNLSHRKTEQNVLSMRIIGKITSNDKVWETCRIYNLKCCQKIINRRWRWTIKQNDGCDTNDIEMRSSANGSQETTCIMVSCTVTHNVYMNRGPTASFAQKRTHYRWSAYCSLVVTDLRVRHMSSWRLFRRSTCRGWGTMWDWGWQVDLKQC